VLTADDEEKSRLQVALSACKSILNHVDHAVRECENRHKLADLQRRLDVRLLENSTEQVPVQYKVNRVHFDNCKLVIYVKLCLSILFTR